MKRGSRRMKRLPVANMKRLTAMSHEALPAAAF